MISIKIVIKHRVREIRLSRGLTLIDLAKTSGISKSMISLIEHDDVNPTLLCMQQLAIALDVDITKMYEYSIILE